MSTDTPDTDHPTGTTITLTRGEELWVARDEETGVASQGETRQEALENLDEAVALHRDEIGEPIDTRKAEREVLKELGIDPDEIDAAREENDELPEFMQ